MKAVWNVAKAAVAVALVQRAAKGAEAVVSRVDVLAGKAVRAGNAKVAKLAERVKERRK